MNRITRGRATLVASIALTSTVATLSGMRLLIRFDQTQGERSAVPSDWPRGSTIERSPDRLELLLFAHPSCPCTAATLTELERVLANRSPGAEALRVRIVVAGSTSSTGFTWARGPLPAGASIVRDDGGRETSIFGVRTSGEVLLYDRRGSLLFHGGITGSRGHAGDNYGAERLRSAMDDGRRAKGAFPVFGCALLTKEQTEASTEK